MLARRNRGCDPEGDGYPSQDPERPGSIGPEAAFVATRSKGFSDA